MNARTVTIVTLALVLLACSACGTAPTALPTSTAPPPPTATRSETVASAVPPAASLIPATHTTSPPTPTPSAASATDTPELSPTVTVPTRTPWPSPTPKPPLAGSGGGVLAFVRTSDDGWRIHAINADGSGERRLLYHVQGIAYPEWSPDGSQIAYHKHQSDEVWSINVADFDGGNERRLTHTETQDAGPVWSPDGSQIAFSRGGDIWLMLADGSDQRLLLDDPVSSCCLDWSPDGSRIVFTSERDGNSEIYSMAIDGSDAQRLTDSPGNDWWPVWSPDGSQIAFMSDRDGDWEIFVMGASGRDVRQLTENTVDDQDPAWSPDGSRIAFSSNRDSGVPFDSELYVMNADGTDQQRITFKEGMEWGVDWSPTGVQGPVSQDEDATVTVGLYADDGAADVCVTAAGSMFAWMGYEVVELDAASVNQDDLSPFDILYFPGGSSDPYKEQIDAGGRDKIRERIRDGGCYIGTCAGAFYAAQTATWKGRDDSPGSLGLFPGTVVGPIPEIYAEPDFGMCQVNLEDHPITEGQTDPAWILYYDGPYFEPDPDAGVEIVGRYEIGGEAALVAFEYGAGRVFLTGPHPEWEEDDDRDGVSYFDRFDDRGSDWDLMRQATRWCLGDLE